jgi:aerobic carbon-monoxide dehydrogenase medium subunit
VRDLVEPETDLHASAEFRRHLAVVLSERALIAAWQRAAAKAA